LVPGYTSGVVHTDTLPNANGRDGAVASDAAHESLIVMTLACVSAESNRANETTNALRIDGI
jgi:hypothetical protein